MVSYQKFVSIVFDTVDEKQIANREGAQTVMQFAADVWNENKEDLKTATVSETRDAVRRAL